MAGKQKIQTPSNKAAQVDHKGCKFSEFRYFFLSSLAPPPFILPLPFFFFFKWLLRAEQGILWFVRFFDLEAVSFRSAGFPLFMTNF